MVSKNNVQVKDRYATKQVPHYGIRKLSVGVASVLLGTTFYMGMNGNVVHADTVNGQDNESSATPDSQVVDNDQVPTDSVVANSALSNSQAVVQAAETVIKSDTSTVPKVTSIENSVVQSQVSQANTSATSVDSVSKNTNSSVSTQTFNIQSAASDSVVSSNTVSENSSSSAATQPFNIHSSASQVQPAITDMLNANLMESADDTVMEQAVQQTSTLRDDRSTDYAGYIKGQAQSVTLKDGSSLSVNSDVINSDTDKSAILTFKSSSFKPGDTYTILIPRIMMNKDSDVAHLQPSFGTTTVDEIKLNNDESYWRIVDHFVNSGTVSQDIKLSRATDFDSGMLEKYFSSVDFWRPYDLIHGTINLIKGTDHGSLDFKYQLGGFTKFNFPNYNLVNGDLK